MVLRVMDKALIRLIDAVLVLLYLLRRIALRSRLLFTKYVTIGLNDKCIAPGFVIKDKSPTIGKYAIVAIVLLCYAL